MSVLATVGIVILVIVGGAIALAVHRRLSCLPLRCMESLMNHAITIGGLLLTVLAMLGLGAVAVGAIVFMAGAFGDETGDSGFGTSGCLIALGGAVAIIVALSGLFW